MLSRFLMLYHTVKTLRSKQVFYRIYYRFTKIKKFKAIGVTRRGGFNLVSPPCWKTSSFTEDGQFKFMGITAQVKWDDAKHPKIWLYNLHYLDHLVSCRSHSSSFDVDLVNSWINFNQPFFGCGWEPYTLSLRIVNMIKWFQQQSTLELGWEDSLATQAHALSERVEYHILANHLFVNGKALVFAGCFLDGIHAERWLVQGLKILDCEVEEQFLADGAHFELSPMYHASLLWDMCDLINLTLNSQFLSLKSRLSVWKEVVERGILWLRSMQHPDGGIPFFNDSAFGIAPTLQHIEAYACLLGCLPEDDKFDSPPVSTSLYLQSGYAAIDLDKGCKALLNLSKVGPDYQPGHTHADTLSFELSLFGKRIFVNSGTSQYGEGKERHRQRSTSAHNTVEVDGENSSEVWSGFRVARRAKPVLETTETDPVYARIRAYHTGYSRLKGKNLHKREWFFMANTCQLIDEVTGVYSNAVARLHVHPDVTFTWQGDALVALLGEGQLIRVTFEGASSVTLQPSTWHPAFGSTIASHCITAAFSSGELVTHISWSGSV